MVPEIPLPWERLLWSGRPRWRLRRTLRYALTDFRIVRMSGAQADEIALHDIADIQRRQSRVEAWLGTSTILVESRRFRTAPLVLAGVRRGPQLAALLELLAGDPVGRFDEGDVAAALNWDPTIPPGRIGEALTALAVVVVAALAVVASLRGATPVARYAPDDPMYPGGRKRGRADIVRFMETDVMPWARRALGPIKGGPSRVTCETCHSASAEAREWRMPAVAALPQPDVKDAGWERYSATMDAQMRNAIYGYVADSEKQRKAGYMREVVMPGMARLLRRPAYDFTQAYAYNRSRLAFGCYHCHRVQ